MEVKDLQTGAIKISLNATVRPYIVFGVFVL